MPETTAAAAAPKEPRKGRIRRTVSPEIAANIREEDEALSATLLTGQAIVQAAVAAANAATAQAKARRDAALRPIMRQLGLDAGDIVATEGFGAATVLVIEISTEPSTSETPNARA
jgi:hypothetical protein